jgi:hypothetical protein
MKKALLAGAALVFVAASPAFAQSYAPDVGSGNLDSWPYTNDPDNPYASSARISPDGAYGFSPYYGAYSYDPYYVPAPVRHGRHRSAR